MPTKVRFGISFVDDLSFSQSTLTMCVCVSWPLLIAQHEFE